MNKKILFVIPFLALTLTFSFSACDMNGDNTANGTINGDNPEITSPIISEGGTNNNQTETPPTDENDNTQIPPVDEGAVTDWETSGIFVKNAPDYEFDFSIENPNFSYETGSDENEEIFASILSGEKGYRNYFGWFSANSEYIYRFNEECYKAAGEIIQAGAFTQELRDKYFGLFVTDTNYPYFPASGITTESYQIYINEDWSIRSIRKAIQCDIQRDAFEHWHYSLTGYTLGGYQAEKTNSEIKQYTEHIYPQYDSARLIGYKTTFASLFLEVDMGDGKTAQCSVDATYESKSVTKSVWNGQKQEHEQVTYLSECWVTADFNNVYSGGYEMFDRILIFAAQNGSWDLFKVWEYYRKEVLTPTLNLYQDMNEQKVYRLA